MIKKFIMRTGIVFSIGINLMFPFLLPAETVRSRVSQHFNSIIWTRNTAAIHAAAPVGVTIPGGTESFAAMHLAGKDSIPGIFPRIEGLGILDYGVADSRLIGVFDQLAGSLKKKTVAESLLRADRRFLAQITGYRLRRVPLVEHVFFSQPDGTDPVIRKSTFSLHTKLEGERSILFIIVEASYSGGSWKITDIQFDSESYAQFFITY